MKIGFDLDRVFVDTPPFVPNKVIDLFYKKKNGRLYYRTPGKLEQKIRIFSHTPILRRGIRKNIQEISRLSKKNHSEIFLISGRFSFLKNRTKEWFKKYKFEKNFKEIYLNFENQQPHLFKNEIIKKLSMSKYIDDDLDLLKYLSKENTKTMFFWLDRRFFPKKIRLPKNITPIRNLEELRNNNL